MDINIICAAYDTPEELKRKADFVCDGKDARPTLQEAVDKAYALDVSCMLLPGTYVINSHGERSRRGGICFYNPGEPHKYCIQERVRYHILEGTKTPIGYFGGAVITMGKEFYDSLPDNETFSLFYCDGNSMYGRAMNMRNLVVRLPANNKPVIVFDGRFAEAVQFENNWITALQPDGIDFATSEGIDVPHPASVGIRGSAGSNNAFTAWKNCVCLGFGVGFDIGGEHVYCESLCAAYNIYGFRFDCYKGKHSIDGSDEEKAAGGCFYPIVCVNLCDEHNVHMPRFGNASHNGFTREIWSQSITIRGMNIQWPNSCPGYTDRTAPDFLDGRHRATEEQPGAWRGSVEYCIDHTTPGSGDRKSVV